MSYLVLARKWRPSTFDEVVGQGHVTRTLKNAIELGRVAHALLFTGSRGVGKTSCARILAKALNCVQGPTTTPCGVCPACTEIGNGTSVDVFEIDGASNNSVEQIREIRESVKFLPTRGKRKMYIIDEVHMLSTSAFNALLKTLEEPPDHVLFVFATTEPHKIPDTIISRCQRYDFKRIPERDIVDAIGTIAGAEGVDVEQAALHHIAREARGGMRDSLSLLDQVIAFCGNTITEAQTREVLGIADRQVLHHLTAAVFEGDGQRALEIIDQLFRFGLDLQKFAAEFVQHLRDLMVVKVCNDPDRLVDVAAEEVAAMAALVRPVDPARIHRVFNALLQGADEVARSPFPKLVLEMTLLRLCHQGATLPLAEVLGGLARLEARLGEAVPDGAPPTSSAPPSSPPTQGGTRGGFGSPGPSAAPQQSAPQQAAPQQSAPQHATPQHAALQRRAPQPTPQTAASQPPPTPGAPAPRPAASPAAPPAPAPSPFQRPPADARPAPSPPRPATPAPAPPSAAPTAPAASAAPTTPARPTPTPAASQAARGPERKTFKRRAADGDVDDFSGDPPEPRPIETLPTLAVKPRAPGVVPGELPPGEELDDAPAADDATPALDADAAEDDDDGPIVATLDLDLYHDPMDAFAALVEQLRAHHALGAGRIEHDTHLVHIDRERLVVGVRIEELEALTADLDRLRRIARAALGDDYEVTPEVLPPERLDDAFNLYRRRAERAAAERRARIDAARRDPMVMLLSEELDAQIIDIHPS